MKLLKRPVNKGLPFGLCFDPSSVDFIVEELTLISSLDGDLSVAAKEKVGTNIYVSVISRSLGPVPCRVRRSGAEV